MRLVRWFEELIQPTATPGGNPPSAEDGLLRFYWHYVRQARLLVLAAFGTGLLVALCDAAIPVMIGRVVTLAGGPREAFGAAIPMLLTMAAFLLLARPAALLLQNLTRNQGLTPGLTNLIRWQSHYHVVRQSWSFFQNDFAGRVASRVMDTGPSLRETIVSTTDAAWYILVYGTSAILLLGHADVWLAAPLVTWFVAYAVFLSLIIPRMRERSKRMSGVKSALVGKVVDSYTNILTVKLFARAADEDAFVRDAMDEHVRVYHWQTRLNTLFSLCLSLLNASMVVGVAGLSIWLWSTGHIAVGTVAMAIPLAWQINSTAGWVAYNITQIFEYVGNVQDGMKTIAVPQGMPDAPGATPFHVKQGAITFDRVRFGYGTTRGVLHDVSLTIAPGERVGLVGRSGAGKSTLVNLLLRFYAPEDGRILIDGQDIAAVTQESLRGQIAMVTQDTSLLHRSIRENIRYGRPDATEQQVMAAAQQAEALDFILGLEDWEGRRGFDAQVGERGVKLSGGQRQRIAIARVILKDAPILILDEATSALDSEVEAAIQGQLATLMSGRTVIAIAHRLSTIAQMDRLIILDQGRVAETGTHAGLLAAGGLYARMWERQSGGFVDQAVNFHNA